MIDGGRNPLLRTMTVITFLRRRYMGRTFTRCGDIVMTARTYSNDLCVIYRAISNRYPWCRARLMTGITQIGTANVVGRFTRCDSSVMTTRTGANDLSVVNRCRCKWRPGCREYRMATVTLVGTINVCCGFTTGSHTIMTTDTVIHKS